MKGGSAHIRAPASYQPISLSSCLSKVYEAILVHCQDEFIDSHDIVIPKQFRFRAHQGCVETQQQLWRVNELIHDCFSTSGVTGAIFLGVQKAFDKVMHGALIFKPFNLAADP